MIQTICTLYQGNLKYLLFKQKKNTKTLHCPVNHWLSYTSSHNYMMNIQLEEQESLCIHSMCIVKSN